MNFMERVKLLPSNTRRLLSLGIIMALVVALPLFIWGVLYGNFNLSEKAVSGEPVPTPTPTIGTSVNWVTPYALFQADDFYILANGKRYYANTGVVEVRSDPGNPTYTTLEVTWHENGYEMRMYIYFHSDGYRWWTDEIRTYNGQTPNDWIYYMDNNTYLTNLGYQYIQNTPGGFVKVSPTTGQVTSEIHYSNLRVRAFLGATPPPTYNPSPTATATPYGYPTPSPSPAGNVTQLFTFRMKFVGVTDGSADGAKVNIRFQNPTIGFDYFTSPVQVHHVGNGVYEASIVFGTATPPLPITGGYVISLKGEKHLATRFCEQTGQTLRCSGNWTIPIPLPAYNPSAFVFDFTGIALEPGDLYQQDGTANGADFTKIKDLLNKPCANLTNTEKLTADLDYSGCVNVRDAFLMRQTLQTRYDEN